MTIYVEMIAGAKSRSGRREQGNVNFFFDRGFVSNDGGISASTSSSWGQLFVGMTELEGLYSLPTANYYKKAGAKDNTTTGFYFGSESYVVEDRTPRL